MTSEQVKFTCLNCRVGFPTADTQRLHYKTDWHRYNLKRKVAGMAPVTAEEFRQRVTQQQQEEQAQQQAEQESEFQCEVCDKRFASRNAMESHVQSRKHKLAAAQPPAPTPSSSNSATATTTAAARLQDGRQPVEEQRRKYAELQRRVEEEWQADQARQEGMEVGPEDEQLQLPSVDGPSTTAVAPEGADAMVTGEAGSEEEAVLALVDSLFDQHRAESLEANVAYMAQQHSLFLPNVEYLVDLEGLVRHLQLKVGNFFTCITCNKAFTGLEAVRNHMESKGHKHLDDSDEGQLEIGPFYDFSSTYPDDSELTDEQRDAELSLATVPQLGQVYRDGFELVLPSGRRAGHREMARYYRQRFQPQDERDSVRIARIVSQYRALGRTKDVLPSEAIRRDQHFALRHQKRQYLDLGVKANKMQHHYREQNTQ